MTAITAKTIILIPTYNEKSNLEDLIQEIRRYTQTDILFIDDNSPDGTGNLAQELSLTHPGIHVLHRQEKSGIGAAYKDGFRWALERPYEFFLMMDADLSHDPAVLPLFMERIQDYDAVFASRYLNGISVYQWSLARLLFSKFSNVFISKMLGLKQSTDTTTAFKCFRRHAIEKVNIQTLMGKKNAFLINLVYETVKSGLKTTEIPFIFSGRKKGKSKSDFAIVAESTEVIFSLFFRGILEKVKLR